ncbi:hypothetical protein F442_09318 [Phytophthora nicotianae P10297]|uniref:Uncharacterized protein n=3 Tax=Phytophthora nicotianae TaxID=4792 RepID=V9F3T4_PHYNI|nr:hypothetical protein F443_09394 [Phytophthora nicotianae P1569]ETO74876.1 hypothetical protein F444_09481 [Phytophthora nicotianae P1976]ETP44056.1 hypothetical protein F442_09318 [Phytophthora nicotianae P10297]
MSSRDLDLVAVCSFLNERSLDEIIQYGAIGATSDRWAHLLDDNDEMTGESSVTGTTSDEASDSEDPPPAMVIRQYPKKPKKPKTELQRKLQQVYDKKSRINKRARHNALGGSFVLVLQEFVGLMQFRIVTTEREIGLLCLAKKNGVFMPTGENTQLQLELNQGALECIKVTVEDWKKRKNGETGKCFLKHISTEIQHLLDNLLMLGEQLRVAMEELRWRLEGNSTGVWV